MAALRAARWQTPHCVQTTKTRRPAKTQNLNPPFFFFKARPQHYAICSAKNALLCGSPSRPHQPGGSRFLRAKCFDITLRAFDVIAQHQPALLRCDELSTALLHHYFYRCRVLAAQKKWRERTQRRRKRLARTATSIRVVGGVRRARRPGCATSTPSAVAAHTISGRRDAVALEATAMFCLRDCCLIHVSRRAGIKGDLTILA